MKIDDALSLIREIPDYPKPGIRFQDITPLLAHGEAFIAITEKFATFADSSTLVAGIEARGFIFASAVANQLRSGFVPIRKAGKLPHLTISESYGLEYGDDTLELHIDAVAPGAKVLLIDDVLATGGTAAAAVSLVEMCSAEVVGLGVVMTLEFLSGREKLQNIQIHSLRSITS